MALNKWGGLNKWGPSGIILGTLDIEATEITNVLGIKNTGGTAYHEHSLSYLDQGNKLISDTVVETVNSSDSVTSFKYGLSDITESMLSAILDTGNKFSSGTALSNGIVSINVSGGKLIVEVIEGTISIDLLESSNMVGSKYTEGSFNSVIDLQILLETLKIFEGNLSQTDLQESSSLGYKQGSSFLNSLNSISEVFAGAKNSLGQIVSISSDNTSETSGNKTSNGSILDVTNVVIELLEETLKSGDLDTYNSISLLLSGLNNELTHITRVNTVLGTVNLRYNPIVGVVDQETVVGTI